MGRMLWVAIGAAGGVYAYRRGQRLLDDARERGLVGSVQATAGSASVLAAQARGLLAGSRAPRPGTATRPSTPGRESAPSGGPTGAAAARVLAESQGPPSRPGTG